MADTVGQHFFEFQTRFQRLLQCDFFDNNSSGSIFVTVLAGMTNSDLTVTRNCYIWPFQSV
jgi:hypothetical protein